MYYRSTNMKIISFVVIASICVCLLFDFMNWILFPLACYYTAWLYGLKGLCPVHLTWKSFYCLKCHTK